MKKILALILAMAMVLSLAACGGTETAKTTAAAQDTTAGAEQEAKEKVLNIAYHDTLASLNPYQGMGDGYAYLYLYGYETLFRKPVTNETVDASDVTLYPVLAKSYTKVDEYTYEIEIYDYIKDSEGNNITADDVVFSFNKCIELGKSAVSVAGIESVTKKSDYVITYKLDNTNAGAFENTVTQVCIVSEKAYNEHDGFVTDIVTTSPYLLTNFISGASYSFVKRDDYWQTDASAINIYNQTNVDKVNITIVTEDATRAGLVESGDADLATRVTQSQLYLFEGNDKYTVFSYPNSLTYVTSFNMGGSKTDSGARVVEENETLRKAILYGIDQSAFVNTVAMGNGGIAKTYGNQYYSDFVDKWLEEDYYDYDLDKAKELLKEAGYEEGELTLTILTSTATTFSKNAEVLQGCLTKMGINSEIWAVDSTVFNDTRNSWVGWDIVCDNKGAGDFVTSVFKYSFDQDMYGGHTQCGYTDEDMQVLLRAALNGATHTSETADAFHQYLKEIAISYGLYYDYYNYVTNSGVKNFPMDDKSCFLFGAAEYDESMFD